MATQMVVKFRGRWEVSNTLLRKRLRKPSFKRTKPTQYARPLSSNTHPALGHEMAKQFDAKTVEKDVYDFWRKSDCFGKPNSNSNGRTFSMVIPPPNVTGRLHIGHALTITIQDSLVRWKKMLGYDVVWVPGLDHAGIATQSVVEKKLFRENKKTRHDIGRENFLKLIWDWKDEFGGDIENQLRRLGACLDWDLNVFTLDKKRSAAVNEAFVRLAERNLLYRKTRLVNWSPTLETAISDLEVDFESVETECMVSVPGHKDKALFGKIHDVSYELVDGGHITVSTTRPETIFGDVAVAVHPEDRRYKHLHGSMVRHPFIKDKLLPIITDSVLVDMNLGTGVVKVTPAHDENDLECARRHQLPEISIIDEKGKMTAYCGSRYAGMPRFECRNRVIDDLKDMNLYESSRDYPMRIPRCSRSGDIIEPLLKPQWFIKCDEMAARATKLVKTNEIEIMPEKEKQLWFHWLDNIQDWCVSRQLWWGHRIPAYKLQHRNVGNEEEIWVVARNLEEGIRKAEETSGLKYEEDFTLVQDEDVLDTWFSSALFPLVSFGWPNKTLTSTFSLDDHLSKYYPLSLMETGKDILFFWVARMVMLCTEMEPSSPPFKKVFLHPLVRDRQGRKMSKSLGNVIDPLDVIDGRCLVELLQSVENSNLHDSEKKAATNSLKGEYGPKGIPACGTDALRLSLASYLQQDSSINMDVATVVTWRKFCNKLWNATAFCLYHVEKSEIKGYNIESVASLSLEEKWILLRLEECIMKCTAGLESIDLGAVTHSIREFVIDELCGVYLEVCKPEFAAVEPDLSAMSHLKVLCFTLDSVLRLLHPIAPYVTEELWQRLGMSMEKNKNSILETPYPSTDGLDVFEKDRLVGEKMNQLLDVAQTTRSLKERLREAVGKISNLSVEVVVGSNEEEAGDLYDTLTTESHLLSKLLRTEMVQVRQGSVPKRGLVASCCNGKAAVVLPLQSGLLDAATIEAKINTFDARRSKLEKEQLRLKDLLVSPAFLENARTDVVQKNRDKLTKLEGQLDSLKISKDTLLMLLASMED